MAGFLRQPKDALMKPEETVKENNAPEDAIKAEDTKKKKDLGGRRHLFDRRRRTGSAHFPERRWHRHRRSGLDRRSPYTFAQRRGPERRDVFRDPEGESPGQDPSENS
jgi:hypothetical protein